MSGAGTVLIISHYFAPDPAVGAKRFSFLAREFTRLGYDVHIITRDSSRIAADASLPVAGHVHRCEQDIRLPLAGRGVLARLGNALLRRLLAPVGWEYFWSRVAVRKALEVARHLPRGIVIATSPPPAAMLAGARVARVLGWPLILDYRDPWSAYDWPKWRRGRLAQWLARRIEAGVVRQSAARVLNTPAMRECFGKFFPQAPPLRNFVISNGFDPAPGIAAPPLTGPIEILHAGEIFTGRSLLPVLEAAARLRQRHPGRPVRIVTYGALPPQETDRIRAAGLEDFIEVRPRVPFSALFAELKRAHLLLAIVGDHMLYSTPYKVYDYMAAGRPILGLAPRGAALFELLADSGAGVCVEPADDAGIERALEQFMNGDSAPAGARVERFQWGSLAKQYRAIIETVAGAHEATPARETAAPGHKALDV
jgi:glycosyltransferase involved in cell wall biosynthesis